MNLQGHLRGRCRLERSAVTFIALFVSSFAASACKTDAARSTATACEKVYVACPGLAVATSKEVTECARIIDGSCGTMMGQYVKCTMGICDDAGLIDRSTTERECGPILAAYRSCEAADVKTTGAVGDDGPSTPTPTPSDAGVTDGG